MNNPPPPIGLTEAVDPLVVAAMQLGMAFAVFMGLFTVARLLLSYMISGPPLIPTRAAPELIESHDDETDTRAVGLSLTAAAQALQEQGRSKAAALVGTIDWKELPVTEQENARTAAESITAAYAHLDRLDPQVADAPNDDGSTPRRDAKAIVASAIDALKRARVASQQYDVDALRSLHRYTARWRRDRDPELEL